MTHPAPTIANNLCLITQRLQSSEWSHVAEITFGYVDNGSHTDLQVVNHFQTEFGAAFQPLFSNVFTIEQATMLRGDGSNVPTVSQATGGTVVGARNISSPPPQVCALIRKNTNVGGRKNRGRTYIPGVFSSGEMTDNGNLMSGVKANIQTAASALLANLSALSIDMVVVNKTLVVDPTTHKPYVTAITHSVNVTSYVVEASCATQRRRLVRS
jgi:hypothetical protein